MVTESKVQKKEKVLIVHNYYQIPGGEDTVVANERKLLEDHGHEVYLYTRNNNEIKTMGILRKILLPIINIYNPRTAKDIKEIITRCEIDVVHVHNTLNLISPAVYYATCKCKVPVIQTVHNFRMLCPGGSFYRNENICEDCTTQGLGCAVKNGCYRGSRIQTMICVISTIIHRFTGIYGKLNYICLTDFNKDKLLLLNKKKKYIDFDRVFVKPNFTFEEELDGIKGSNYLFIGRVEKMKGIDLLIRAFSCMPDKQLKIAGTGMDLEKYKNLGMENVEFLGFLNRQQLASQIANAKAVIVPSQCYETFGMIVVEAYSFHKPVIVGDIGNVASLVEDGVTGIKFKYNDFRALVDAIDRFEKCELMGEECYRKYKKEFSPEANYRYLAEIYGAIR